MDSNEFVISVYVAGNIKKQKVVWGNSVSCTGGLGAMSKRTNKQPRKFDDPEDLIWNEIEGNFELEKEVYALEKLSHAWFSISHETPLSAFKRIYKELNDAASKGDPESQALFSSLLFFQGNYSAGLTYASCASFSENMLADLLLGFRFAFGRDGAIQSCHRALGHYKSVAKEAVKISNVVKNIHTTFLYNETSRYHHPERRNFFDDVFDSENQPEMPGSTYQAIGEYYLFGINGFPNDDVRAAKFFNKAASSGNSLAYNRLGFLYWKGIGVEKNISQALTLFELAASFNISEAHQHLGFIRGFELSASKQDFLLAERHFTTAIELGHRESYFYLGLLHHEKKLPHSNLSIAVQLFEKAVAHVNVASPRAAFRLGLIYEEELYDCEASVKFFKLAAEYSPNLRRSLDLGWRLFLDGYYISSFLIFARNAEMGFDNGQSNAAWLMGNEFEVMDFLLSWMDDNDEKVSALESRYHNMSARQGNAEELRILADKEYNRWYNDNNSESNLQIAIELYEAASTGSGHALFTLGYIHHFGAGHTPKDLRRALEYYDRSMTVFPSGWVPCMLAKKLIDLELAAQTFSFKILAAFTAIITSILWAVIKQNEH